MDSGIVKTLPQSVRDDEVINTPTRILLTRLESVGPPGILHLLRIFETEAVSKASSEQFAELGTFLISKASIMTVGLGILDINLFMSHIQVTTKDNGFLLIETLEIGTEGIFPRHAIIETFQAILRIRCVTADEVEIRHFKRDDTAFVVVLIDTDTIGHIERLVAGKDGGTRIAFLIGIVPIRLIALKGQIKLSFLHLRLLEAEEVGIQLTENLTESFTLASAKSIDIPTDKFHMLKIFWLQSYEKKEN